MTADTGVAQVNAAAMKRAIDAFVAGDTAMLAEVFAPDVRWHLPGRSAIAGDYVGRDAVFGLFARMAALTDGTIRTNCREVIGDDEGGVIVTTDTGERGGRKLNAHVMLRAHVRDGKLVELWEHIADLYAYDEFWSSKQQDPGTE
jgi:ketosteroid isomerase-like protein